MHRGVYYAPGSLKARLCVEGAERLLGYCDERGIPVLRCGKVVVAADDAERPRLAELHRRAVANGVPGVELIGAERLARARAARRRRRGAPLARDRRRRLRPGRRRPRGGRRRRGRRAPARHAGSSGSRAAAARPSSRRRAAPSRRHGWSSAQACTRIGSPRCSGAPAEPRIVPFRGDYLALRPERRHLVRGLVYPVPDPAFPFLGIHTTTRPDGEVWLGPNAVLALAREGYRRRDVSLRDVRDAVRSGGLPAARAPALADGPRRGRARRLDAPLRRRGAAPPAGARRRRRPARAERDPGAGARPGRRRCSTTSSSTRRTACSTSGTRPRPAPPRRSRSRGSSVDRVG